MTIIVPGAIFAAGISLYLFYEYNRAKEDKQIERREKLNDRRQEYLQKLLQSRKKEQDATTADPPTTGRGSTISRCASSSHHHRPPMPSSRKLFLSSSAKSSGSLMITLCSLGLCTNKILLFFMALSFTDASSDNS